jgi:hypothetical protein
VKVAGKTAARQSLAQFGAGILTFGSPAKSGG